jgi:iron complex outermembrane recepter protein
MKIRGSLTLCVSVIAILASQSALAQQAPATSSQATPATPEVETVIVVGTRGSVNAARNAERIADGITSVITADDAGNFADQNVAESLQRLPGVSIERSEGEGRFVSVRGLNPAFNNVTLNGVKLGSTEKGDGSVALDTLPADLLDQVEVSKTPTPDLDGDAIGGTIEIKTLSAFGRREQGQLRVEGSYNEIADATSPKVSGSITRRFDVGGEDTFGVAFAASYFGRKVQSDQLRNDEGLRCVRVGATSNALAVVLPTDAGCDQTGGYFLRPQELDVRIKTGERIRLGGTLNLEFKPNDQSFYFFRTTFTQIEDTDTRLQQETEFRRVTDRRDILAIGPRSGDLDNIRYEPQIFFQETTDKVSAFSLGGENKLDGGMTVNYQGDYSVTSRTSPGIRARFQERGGRTRYTLDDESITIETLPGVRVTPSNASVLTNLDFEQLFIDAEVGEDAIYTGKVDFTKELTGATPMTIKFGAKFRERTKETDVDEFEFTAAQVGMVRTMGTFTTFAPSNSILPFYAPFPNLAELRTALDAGVALALTTPAAGGVLVAKGREDFLSRERVSAAYGMVSFDPIDDLKIIAGMRVETTEFTSQGQFVLDNEAVTVFDTGTPGVTPGPQTVSSDASIANPNAKKSYTNYLPSIVARYDVSPKVLLRAAWTNAIQRPNFEDSRNVHSATLTPGTNPVSPALRNDVTSISLGNPNLDPAKASQFDASVNWYPNRNTALTFGVFYKRISDFIFDANLNNVDLRTVAGGSIPLPAVDPGNQGGYIYDSVEVALNGDVGTIKGAEFSYNQAYTFFPKPFDGLFTSLSVTWADSEATSVVRADKFAFPGQSKWIVAASAGYENKKFSLRGSMTYRDGNLASLSDVAVLDELRKSYLSYDINMRYDINNTWQIYADAININEARDIRYYRGDANGGFFQELERFGSTYQIGIKASF